MKAFRLACQNSILARKKTVQSLVRFSILAAVENIATKQSGIGRK